MKKIDIRKPFDEWVYTKLDELSNHPEVQKILDNPEKKDQSVIAKKRYFDAYLAKILIYSGEDYER